MSEFVEKAVSLYKVMAADMEAIGNAMVATGAMSGMPDVDYAKSELEVHGRDVSLKEFGVSISEGEIIIGFVQ